MDFVKFEVSPELREAMQRFADAIGDVGEVGKAIGEYVGRMFPDGFPKLDVNLNLNFNLVERPKTIADILVGSLGLGDGTIFPERDGKGLN